MSSLVLKAVKEGAKHIGKYAAAAVAGYEVSDALQTPVLQTNTIEKHYILQKDKRDVPNPNSTTSSSTTYIIILIIFIIIIITMLLIKFLYLNRTTTKAVKDDIRDARENAKDDVSIVESL